MFGLSTQLLRFLSPANRAKPILEMPRTIAVRDTLNPAPESDPSAARMLAGLSWTPETFEARVDFEGGAVPKPGEADATLRFPSPFPRGEGVVDEVALDCWAARDVSTGAAPVDAPAVLLLDILQGGNVVANVFARALSARGTHCFVMHMPFTGKRRRDGQNDYDWREFLPSLHQAVTDARRARDVIAALPFVRGPVGIQGSSLGGFVATVAAAIDNAFDPVIVAVAGADVYRVLTQGRIDAARVYRRLKHAGHDDYTLRRSLWKTEPLRIAHRLDPRRTFLISARRDNVVPRYNTELLASAASIHPEHHLRVPGGHYTCVLSAPSILTFVQEALRSAQIRHGRPAVAAPASRPVSLPEWALDLEASPA